jgi:hypothetical protein
LTTRKCRYTGEQLPSMVSCAALCESFPACLPPLPHDIAHDIEASGPDIEAVAESLEAIHAAIMRGLEK